MNDDEEKFSLRDKLAMEILNGLLLNKKEIAERITDYLLSDDPAWRKNAEEKSEHLAHACYKMADIMRKARLATFE